MPTETPSDAPTSLPSAGPSCEPSTIPSGAPSVPPSNMPTETPSYEPTTLPSVGPSCEITYVPSAAPTAMVTVSLNKTILIILISIIFNYISLQCIDITIGRAIQFSNSDFKSDCCSICYVFNNSCSYNTTKRDSVSFSRADFTSST